MKIYYLQSEYENGKHRIIKVWAEVWGLVQPKVKPTYSVIELDEYYNRELAGQLFHNNRERDGLPDLFYVDNFGNIRNNSTDQVVPINLNPQREAFKLSQLYGLTHEQLDNHIDGIANLSEAKEFMGKMAHVVLYLVKQTKLDE